MNSWQLFSHIVAGRHGYNHPVFLREAEHRPVWYASAHRIARSEGLRISVLAAASLAWVVSVLYANNLLVLVLLPELLLLTTTGLTLGSIVIEERIKQSWEPLLTTPGGIEWVLVGKAGGALWWIRYMVRMVAVLLLPLTAGVGLVSLILIPRGVIHTEGSAQIVLCGFMLALPIAGSLLFVLDRVQHYVLLVTTAIAASATARSIPRALSTATASMLLVWLSEIMLIETLLIRQSDRVIALSNTHMLLTATMGPMVGYMLEMTLFQALPYIAGTLVIREATIRLLWHWALRHAHSK